MAGGFSGSQQVVWNGENIAAQLEAAIEQGLIETGVAAQGVARSLARVDTGEMRDSIDYTVTRSGGQAVLILSVGTDHGIFNELGTSRLPAQPMIRPAIDREGPKVGDRIRAALGAA
jgi:HK97 gp10 family phage protein